MSEAAWARERVGREGEVGEREVGERMVPAGCGGETGLGNRARRGTARSVPKVHGEEAEKPERE